MKPFNPRNINCVAEMLGLKASAAQLPKIGDLLTLTDGVKCKLHGLPSANGKLGWRVSFWYDPAGCEVHRVIQLEQIAVNHSRPLV